MKPLAPAAAVLAALSFATMPARADDGDSGLGLEWVYLNADVGGSYVDMQSLSTSNFGLQTTKAGGPVYGVGAGARILFFSVGARLRDQSLSSIGDLWEVDGEAAFHMRIWQIDPYFGARAGYTWLGSFSTSALQPPMMGNTAPDVQVHGFDVGPMVGIDLYFTKLISLGVEGEAEFLILQRPPPALPPGVSQSMIPAQYAPLYQNSGSSVGLGAVGTAHLGIHF
jgi:hypothetical protein